MIAYPYLYQPPNPGLLIAESPQGHGGVRRHPIAQNVVVGRGSDADFCFRDQTLSKRHFRLSRMRGRYWIEDLKSTNGTFVDGMRLLGSQVLPSPAVIRAGQTIFVYHAHAGLLPDPPSNSYGLIGPFHIGAIIEACKQAGNQHSEILLFSANGLETQLIARIIANFAGRGDKPFVVCQAAEPESSKQLKEEIVGSGKRRRGQKSGAGPIERAAEGTLFISGFQLLKSELQSQLLTVSEMRKRSQNVLYIFGCERLPEFSSQLANVNLPPLSERVADIPAIFDNLLRKSLKRFGLDTLEIFNTLQADHYEALMLDAFEEDNLLGIAGLTTRIAEYLASGTRPDLAVARVLKERGVFRSVAGRKYGEFGPEHSDTMIPEIPPDVDTIP